MTQFAIVRHGVTDWNMEGRMQGHQDIPLNDLGRDQAARLASRLQQEHWDAIVYSDLMRATQTALCIADLVGIECRRMDVRLRERSFGLLEGTTLEERVERWGINWKHLSLGVEDDECLRTRAALSMDHFTSEYRNQKIIVVTHGGWISQFFKVIFPYECREHPTNTSLSVIHRHNDTWSCTLYNSTSHLNNQ